MTVPKLTDRLETELTDFAEGGIDLTPAEILLSKRGDGMPEGLCTAKMTRNGPTEGRKIRCVIDN